MLTFKKKMLSLVMTAAMTTTLFAGMAMTVSASSSADSTSTLLGLNPDPESGTYVIYDQTDMNSFVSYVNAGRNTNGLTFQISDSVTDPLNVTSVIAPPAMISSASTNSPYVSDGTGFRGTFDGNGKTINETISTSASGTGLFGYLAPTGVVEDLNVTGTVSVTGSKDAIGGVVGYNSGIIDKVTSSVAISAGNSFNVGGIAGFNNGYYNTSGGALVSGTDTINGYILNCANDGNVTGYRKVGGVVGENAGTVNSCSNEKTIVGKYSGKNGVGGIAGSNGNNNSPVETAYIWNCYNTGNVICSSTGSASTTASNLGSWVGGMAGLNNAYSAIANCYSTGNVNAYAYRDYIVGNNEGTVSNNYAVPGSDSGDPSGYFTPQGYDYTIVLTAAQLAATGFYQTLGVSNTARWQNGTTYPVLTNTATTSDYSLVPHFTYSATTAYSAGQTFNHDNSLVVTAEYNDSTPTTMTVPSSDYSFSPTGALTTSNSSVSVTGRYRGVPISLSIPISVGTYSFELSANPSTTTYTAGQIFNPSGAVVTVKENDEVVATINTGFTLSESGPLTTTDTSIALSGSYSGESFSFDVPITVNAASSATLGTGYFTNLERALDAVSSGGTITVLNPIDVSVSGTVTRNDNVTIVRGSGFTADGTNTALFNITAGTLRLTTMTISGAGTGTLFNVTGGELVLRGNAKPQNCATAVNVATGGKLTVNKAQITASANSIVSAGTLEINDFGGTTITGPISVTAGTGSMNGGTISGYTTTTGNGGGLNLSGGTFTMSGGTISGNTAVNGGGVYIANGGTFTMTGGSITGNTATTAGSGVYVSPSASFNLSCSGVDSDNDVYLASETSNGVTIHSTISLKDTLSGSLIVTSAVGDSGTIVAIGDTVQIARNSYMYITVNGSTARSEGILSCNIIV